MEIDQSEETLRKSVSEDFLRKTANELCSIGEKVSGSVEEQKACKVITSKLDEYGIEYKVHRFQSYVSAPVSASLVITSPETREIEAVGVSFGLSTPTEGFSGKVVFAGTGTLEEFERVSVEGK